MGILDMFGHKYPFTDFHELNLDWCITAVLQLQKAFEDFSAGNKLIFANPLQHDLTKTYAKNTIVIGANGNAYMSLKPVPVGVELTDTDYWLMVFDFEDYTERANKNFTDNYFSNTDRAPHALAASDWVVLDDVLYKVTVAIAADDLFIIGTNIVHFTIEQFLKDFITSVNTTLTNWYDQMTETIDQYKDDIDASELEYRQQLAQDIATTTASLQAQLDLAISGATVDSEVINARIGANGVTYDTLGNCIRDQIGSINTSLIKNTDTEILYGWIDNYYIKTNATTADISEPVSNASFRYLVVDCAAGDKFTINGTGGGAPRLWAFIDDDSPATILDNADSNTVGDDLVITAPASAAKLIINDSTKTSVCFKGIYLKSLLDDMQSETDEIQQQVNDISIKLENIADSVFSNEWTTSVYSSATISDEITAQYTVPDKINSRVNYTHYSELQADHTYYCRCMIKADQPIMTDIYVGDGFVVGTSNRLPKTKNTWHIVSGIHKVLDTPVEMSFYAYPCDLNTNTTIDFKNPLIIDITDIIAENPDITNYMLDCIIGSDAFNKETYALRKFYYPDVFVIAGSNSKYKKIANAICEGVNDQLLINEIIANSNVDHIYITPDSTINLSAEIVLKSDFTIESDGALFTTPTSVTHHFIGVSQNEASINTSENISDILPGAFVEIVDADDNDIHQAFYVNNVSYGTNYDDAHSRMVFRSAPNASRYITSNYVDNSTVRNVSSCFGGWTIENVTIKGITIDWNFDNNSRSYNTFWAQNGIHLYECRNIIIENCVINNGGRHGISFAGGSNSIISKCMLNTWGEHCIDIYTYDDLTYLPQDILIEGCTCSGAWIAGIQLHRGSGVRIVGCSLFNNKNGISSIEFAHDNVISSCQIRDNEDGIYMRTGANNDVISGCDIYNNTSDGVVLAYVTGTNYEVKRISINNNLIHHNGEHGVHFLQTIDCIIADNDIYDNVADTDNADIKDIVIYNSVNSSVVHNVVKRGNELSNIGIRCAGSDSEKNVIAFNVMRDCVISIALSGHDDTEQYTVVI